MSYFKMMKMKKLVIFFLVLMWLISIVSAVDSADIVESSKSLSRQQGQPVQDSFTVENDGNTTLNLAFTGRTLTMGSESLTVNLNPSSINNMQNGTSQVVNFDIVISSNQALGVYSGAINVTNASNGNIFDSMQLDVTVTSFSLSSSPSLIFFDNARRNSSRSATFTITNDGNGDLTGVTLTSTAASKYNVSFNKTSAFNLNVGESEAMTVTVFIPADEQTTNHSIGSIVVNSNEANLTVATISIDVRGGLIIEDFDVRVYYKYGENDGKSDVHQGVKNAEKLDYEDGVRPGSELKFDIDVENTFSTDEDIDIEDVRITITIEEIEEDGDLDEESQEFDLEAGESERFTIFFEIPLEVEEGDYNIIIEVEGEDTEGTEHRVEWNLEMQLEKERRNIIIRDVSLSQDTVSCARNTRLSLDVLNIGTKEEDEVKVEVINADLDLNFAEDDISLGTDPFDEDDEFKKSIDIKVPSDLEAGTYPIAVNLYITGGALFDSEILNLNVENCGVEEEQEEEEQETEEEESVETQEPEVEEEQTEQNGTEIPVIEGTVTESQESRFSFFLAILVVVGLVAVALGIFIGIKLIPRKEI